MKKQLQIKGSGIIAQPLLDPQQITFQILTERTTLAQAPTEIDKHTTVFIACIPRDIDDLFIENLLLVSFPFFFIFYYRLVERVTDPDGTQRNYGFAVYVEAIGAMYATKYLGGDINFQNEFKNGIFLPSKDKSYADGGVRLKVINDEPAKRHIDIFRRTMRHDENEIQLIQLKIDNLIQTITPIDEEKLLLLKDVDDDPNKEDGEEVEEKKTENILDETDRLLESLMEPALLPQAEQRQIITKEIDTFRQRSALRDLQKKLKLEKDRQILLARQKDRESRLEHLHHAERREDQSSSNSYHKRKSNRSLEDIDSEDEKIRAERRKKELHDTFIEEQNRFKRIEKEELKKIEFDEGRERNREYWYKKLSEYDDDIESKIDEFFTDRDRWYRRRVHFRSKELQEDSRDKRALEQQKSLKLRQSQQTQQYSSSHRGSHNGASEEAMRAAEEERIRREHSGFKVDKIMTMEERTRAIQTLVESIPSSKDDIWNFPVQWEFLDDSILNTLIAFVNKKLLEYLGDEDVAFANDIVGMVKSRAGVQTVYNHIYDVFNEEDEVQKLVLKIWRRLIYETESRAQSLS